MSNEIIIFSRSLPFHHLGGMEVVAWDLAVELGKSGYKVTVVTTEMKAEPVKENASYPNIISLKNIPVAEYSTGWWKETEELISGWPEKEKVRAVISISAGAFSCLKYKNDFPNARFIMQAHGTSVGEILSKIKTGKIKKILSCIKNIKGFYGDAKHYKYFDWIVAVGDAVFNDLTSFPTNQVCNSCNVIKIENGIDQSLFSDDVLLKERLREELCIPQDALVFLSASRLHEQKGVDNNIQLFKRIKEVNNNVKYIICGDGPYENNLRNDVERLALSNDVIFVGSRTRPELAKLMQCADAFLFLTKRVEGLPLNLLEAMSAGLPIIISDHLYFDANRKIFKCNPYKAEAEPVLKFLNESGIRESYIPQRNTLKFSVESYISLFR
jgi:glycosyltransferase involved in cell wall biosynthesis